MSEGRQSAGLFLSWSNPRVRGIAYQVIVVGAVLALFGYLVLNTLENLARQGIATGFSFLDHEAAFAIGESLIAYSPADTYLRAFAVGLTNTLKVAIIGVVLATVLGTVVGIARVSGNWLTERLSLAYVEMVRNVPLLLQLLFWYALLTHMLPRPREALSPIVGVFLSNRGFYVPSLADNPLHAYALAALVAGLLAGALVLYRARGGKGGWGPAVAAIALTLAPPLLVYVLGGTPIVLDIPELKGLNFRGGARITPEFAALLIGLVVYTSAFIAEIVRGGIESVARGQREAAAALGLSAAATLRFVMLPQALRVIVPPLTSQYLNLTKNSSLAVAIGYPDLVSIANTTINQTGQAVEGIAVIMAVYLTISLTIAAFMNLYNRKIALKG
jgi:general L-amino acid transport system permease protein